MWKPATTLISVKRVLLESNGIPLSPTCAAPFTSARVLEIALTGSSPLRRQKNRAGQNGGWGVVFGGLKERDKQMSAVVGDAGEVTRAGLFADGHGEKTDRSGQERQG